MSSFLVSSTQSDSVLCYDGQSGRFRGAFVAAGSGGLKRPQGLAFGPDGNLYVSSFGTGQVLRYDGAGVFDKVFASGGGLQNPAGLIFGPDHQLYVADFAGGGRVLRYNGITGAFDKSFLSGIDPGTVVDLVFGPDGNLYASGNGSSGPGAGVYRYNGSSGVFDKAFVPGISAAGLAFGTDKNLYAVVNDGVQRYDGRSGAPIDLFAAAGPLRIPTYLAFGPDGDLFVSSAGNASVLRYDGATGRFGAVFASGGGLAAPSYLLFTPS